MVGGVRPPSVGPRDGLEERVEPERLIQVKHALIGCVEAGEELRGHDEERERVRVVEEPPLQSRLFLPAEFVVLPSPRLMLRRADRHHDFSRLLSTTLLKESGDFLVVRDAEGTVESHHLRLHA